MKLEILTKCGMGNMMVVLQFENFKNLTPSMTSCGYHSQTSVTEVKHGPLRIVRGCGTELVD